jgi:hypothetical protein
MATPDPSNVSPWYLRNINQALALDETTGTVYLNTNAQIIGNVTIGTSVDAHISEIGTSGNLQVPYMPIAGNITIDPGQTVEVTQGTNPWIVSLDNNYSLDNAPWQLQVARNQVSGVQGLSISGYSSNVGTTFIPAWEDGTYVYFNSAQQVRVWSASASDTNVSVLVSGLDASYNILTETVVLTNGTTGVLTSGSFLRINSISLTRVPQNVGLLRAGSSDKSITLAYIGTVNNNSAGRSQMTVYTVPAGYTFYLTQSNWYTNQTGSQTALYRSWTKNPSGLVSIVLTFPMQQQYNSTKVVPRPYPEKTDIQWQVASSSGTSNIGGQIEGYLIANNV